MKVIEHLDNASSPLLSFEIIPPARGQGMSDIVNIVEQISPYNPSWIDVTAHASSVEYLEKGDGSIEKRVSRKRPGTMGICGVIQNRFKIDTVAHLLCGGFTKEETEDALIELNYLGVENVLALRGDGPNYKKSVNSHRTVNPFASDLVKQIKQLGDGHYLDQTDCSAAMDFCVGVAGYPEKHFEAPSLKQDVSYLKQKLDAGADYVTTQLFYDNNHYFNFVDQCRTQGIEAPIVPGLKILKSVKQLQTVPKSFFVDFPDDLVQEVMANPQHVVEIGIQHALKQAVGLLEGGAPCVHFYIMNDAGSVVRIAKHLQKLL
jgi:methylenetetrahydrofolate reductase (NADPH)